MGFKNEATIKRLFLVGPTSSLCVPKVLEPEEYQNIKVPKNPYLEESVCQKMETVNCVGNFVFIGY